MKRIFTLLIVLAFAKVQAQNSTAVLFTENGERFQIVLNGVIQNIEAATNVKLTDLVAPNYKMKVLFEDKSLGEINKNFYVEAYSENTFNIKRKNNGEWAIRIQSITPLNQLPPSPAFVPNQNVVVYHANPYPVLPAATTTTTTTTTTYNDPNDNVNINMGINGVGFNMNVNGGGVGNTSSQTTTTYSTTTTTNAVPQPVYVPNQTTTTVVVQEPVYLMPGYGGPVGCPYPMSPQDFAGVKSSIQSKTFEDTKLVIAKQVLSQRCMTSAQVKEIMSLFTFENTRLDFAKFSYGLTYDIGNYYQVNDAFTFESSIDDLNNYINGYRR